MQKIAFLFLIREKLFHANYWQLFFAGHEKKLSVYVHAKEKMANDAYLKMHELPVKVPTSWANTMAAQLALLQEALKDKGNKRFVFVSESTIPLQDFNPVYKKLMSTFKSYFWHMPNPYVHEVTRNLQPLTADKQFTNFQWVVLNRKHAQLLVDSADEYRFIMQYECDNEHYPSTVLAEHNELTNVICQDTTFVVWPAEHGAHPITFTDLGDFLEMRVVKQGIQNGHLFARKFAQDCLLNPLHKYLPYHPAFDAFAYDQVKLGNEVVSLRPGDNVLPCKKCGMRPLKDTYIFPH